MSEEGELVQLYVYDLSNGLARQFSPLLLGKQVRRGRRGCRGCRVVCEESVGQAAQQRRARTWCCCLPAEPEPTVCIGTHAPAALRVRTPSVRLPDATLPRRATPRRSMASGTAPSWWAAKSTTLASASTRPSPATAHLAGPPTFTTWGELLLSAHPRGRFLSVLCASGAADVRRAGRSGLGD